MVPNCSSAVHREMSILFALGIYNMISTTLGKTMPKIKIETKCVKNVIDLCDKCDRIMGGIPIPLFFSLFSYFSPISVLW